ncbi:MAG: IS982 family transposase [bacterium]|nr:IS982 family transposase [bacterium]
MDVVEVFYWIDEFCGRFDGWLKSTQLKSGEKKRNRASRMNASEVIAIIVLFHWSGYRNFKTFYKEYVCQFWQSEFPNLLSYNRFVELMQEQALTLFALAQACNSTSNGINFIDSTTLVVCNNRRIHNHKVFAGLAKRGKSSMGYFFGFKLHIIINDQGEIVNFVVTDGSVADNNEKLLKNITQSIFGKLFGDKGYITKIRTWLYTQNIQLITKIRSNMKNILMPLFDKLLLRKRAVVESVNDQLKNIFQIEHTRHRSPKNFLSNLFAGLVAYKLASKKPSLHLNLKLALS